MNRQRRHSRSLLTPRNLAAVGVLALLFLIGLFFLGPRNGTIEVPNVVGLTAGNATGVLTSLGFDVDIEEVADDEATVGTVVRQVPEFGSSVPAGSHVVIQIAVETAASSSTASAEP